MKKTSSNLSVALLSKNPCEEKSLRKKLDEIDKMKNKFLRQSAAKMTNFAIQHLYIAKYYDAKNGEQCRPPLKVAQESVCCLPRLTTKRQQSSRQHMLKKSASSSECFERRDCATSRPSHRRSLLEKSLSLSEIGLAAEKESAPISTDADCNSQDKPKSARADYATTAEVPKQKCGGRSLSEVTPPKSVMLDKSAQSENAPRRFHAWTEKENKETLSTVTRSNSVYKPKYRGSLSQCVSPSKLPFFESQQGTLSAQEEDCEKVNEEGSELKDGGKEGGIHQEAVKGRSLQRRVTVASEAPYISREVCRWQQTVKLVKDLPKSEQAEILRGACFFRMALPFSYVPKPDKPVRPAGRQRKTSTITAP